MECGVVPESAGFHRHTYRLISKRTTASLLYHDQQPSRTLITDRTTTVQRVLHHDQEEGKKWLTCLLVVSIPEQNAQRP